MKFETKEIKLSHDEWIKAQSDALQFLERNKQQDQKINQALILQTAADQVVAVYRNTEMQQQNAQHKDKIYFLPIVSDLKFTIDEISFNFKTYYEDNLEAYSVEIKPNAEFKLPSDFADRVKVFTEQFMSNYKFRIPSSQETINSGDNVEFNIKVVGMNEEAQKFVAVASLEGANPVEKALVGMKVNETKQFNEMGNTFEITPLVIYHYQEMPITELNVHLLNIANIKTLEDVKNHIHEVTLEQTVNDEAFSYGDKIVTQILENNKGIFKIPEDLVENDLKEFAFSDEFKGDKYEVVKSTIENYFWTILIMKHFDFTISQEDVNNEFEKLVRIVGQAEAQRIGAQRLSNIFLFKKIAVVYLEKYQNDDFKKYEKYLKNYLSK
ncbi:trigger factor-related chaperone [Mycoplasma seminis]|uniref:Trigger factor n=1 Tax=Mycoplasma seminis TaxID=512749 RepID=A0ABY9HA80_9MOLU|nr:hypothetical protein [Mycoplasma seminis]WLP85508.1 hypothetical protein Q8852_04285 [Mycoplasma seminis]